MARRQNLNLKVVRGKKKVCFLATERWYRFGHEAYRVYMIKDGKSGPELWIKDAHVKRKRRAKWYPSLQIIKDRIAEGQLVEFWP